jgi:hypothetical protein
MNRNRCQANSRRTEEYPFRDAPLGNEGLICPSGFKKIGRASGVVALNVRRKDHLTWRLLSRKEVPFEGEKVAREHGWKERR